uniref:protein-tyrosine-phosphatase n=1 Tax=Cynoglossus semilaevis TaxID=244447 RepID=A0A3P8WU49_CYNSE
LLDVSALGVETVSSVSTPKEVWLQLLHTSSRPLTKEQLRQAAEDTNTLNAEYQKIPTNFVSAAELDVPGHAIKDRYKTILPSQCLLSSHAGPVRYINANYIRGYRGTPRSYIATQGPTIKVLEDEEEQRRKQSVDHEEESEVTNQFGRFHLRVKHCREEDGFTVTDLEIQLGSEHRPIRHYWFTSWPDHHIPKCTAPLLLMVEEVETYRKSLLSPDSQPGAESAGGPGPIIVHCSAGIGRTGCFIASSIGVQQLRDTDQADIQETVCQLRLDSRYHWVCFYHQ